MRLRTALALAAALASPGADGAWAAPGPSLLGAPAGATSCSGCHLTGGTAGSALPGIYGRPAAEIVAALAAFRSGERPATVMNRIVPGFSEAELGAIATWLARQRPAP